MPQQIQFPCGCVETIFNPMDPALMYVEMCPQHLAIANNPENKQPLSTILPQRQTSTTIPGIPSHPFAQFQRVGSFHPGQMPPPGVGIRIPQPGTGR